MNKLKRFLAMALALCMMLGMMPVNVFAEESGDVTEMTDETVAAVSEGETEEDTESIKPIDTVEIFIEGPTLTSGEVGDLATADSTNTTTGQPFASGTANSTYFRIPALTTLSDGTLVAAADARWNDIYDKGNIDTLVSVSKDNGATWIYNFANYIADYADSYNIQAATFIDPAMAVKTVDGVETIYMVVDLFPGQASGSTMCIVAALDGTGMDENGHLLVSDQKDNDLSAMNYYVGDFDSNNMANLCNSDGTASGYTVDAWFNIYDSTGTKLGNLFTYDATGFYVYQTSYLYLTKSTDGGCTWSAPKLLNHQLKKSSEKFYGVGPASGLVTSDGVIMYTAYTFTSTDGNTSVFYSKDNGVTWNRGADLPIQSSEAALAEADGYVYMFNRYGACYYTDDYGVTWTKLATNAGYASGCEVSAMTYSKEIDGQTAILVAGPTSGRTAGKIFVGLVNDDHTINWKYTYSINGSNPFQYSAMTELSDGSIGILYENTANTTAGMIYENIAISTIAPDATINDSFDFDLDVNISGVITVDPSAGVKSVTTTAYTFGSDENAPATDYVAYDIDMYTDTEKTQVYTGASTVSVSVSEEMAEMDPSQLKGFYVDENGQIVDVYAVEIVNGVATFDVAYTDIVGVAVLTDDEQPYYNTVNLTLYEGGSKTISVADLNVTGSHTSDAANVTWAGSETEKKYPEAQLGSDISYSGKLMDLNKCLYTFTKNDDGTWVISADGNGTTVYVDPYVYSNGGYPNRTYSTNVTLGNGSNNGIWFYDGTGYLHFWDNSSTNLYWDNCTGNSCSGHNLLIYKVADTSNNTTVLGGYFTQVTDVANLVSGEKYLIVGKTTTGSANPNAYYAMHPSTDTSDKWAHLAKITGNFGSETTESTQITITANAIGTTSVIIGTTKYEIEVLESTIHVEDADGTTVADRDQSGKIVMKVTDGAQAFGVAGIPDGYGVAVVSTDENVVTAAMADTTLTLTPLIPGKATVTITIADPGTPALTADDTTVSGGVITLDVTVEPDNIVEKTIYVGDTEVISADGDYTGNNAAYADSAYAYVSWTGFSDSGATATTGTDANYTGESILLKKCLYTFTASGSGFIVSAVADNGTTVYLHPYGALNGDTAAKLPNATVEGTLTFTLNSDNTFYIKDASGYLYFWRDGKNRFDRQSGTASATKFYIYTPTDGDDSSTEIPGFKQVTAASELTDGGEYLIVAYYNSAYYVLRPSTATSSVTSSEYMHVAKVTGVTESFAITDITIEGRKKGYTEVIIGDTMYKITVEYKDKSLSLLTGSTVTLTPAIPVTESDIEAFNTANGAYVTAKLNENGTVTVTGVAEGTVTDYVLGGIRYTIDVQAVPECVDVNNTPFVVGGAFIGNGDELTKLTISSVLTGYDIALNSAYADAESITWSIADESVATITVADDGQTIQVNAVAPGTTFLTVTIDGESYTMPIVVLKTTTDGVTSYKYTSLHIESIVKTTVYYSWDCSGDTADFVEAVDGESIWVVHDYTAKYCINFYGKPDPDYALTFMAATNSKGEYESLQSEDPTQCEFYLEGAGRSERIESGFTDQQVADDIQAALNLGCDGAQGFSRGTGAGSDVNGSLTFISEKLPTVSKSLNGVLAISNKQTDYRRYSEGVTLDAKVGEHVYFNVTVEIEAPLNFITQEDADGNILTDEDGNPLQFDTIRYTDVVLEDLLPGAYFYTKDQDPNWDGVIDENDIIDGSPVTPTNVQYLTEALNAAWTQEEIDAGKRVLPYFVVFEITEEYLDKDVVNDVKMTYTYGSKFSAGTTDAAGYANADIHVTGGTMDSYVIDFGQKLIIEDADEKFGFSKADLTKTELKYGKLERNGDHTLIYTPNTILQSAETVILYMENGNSINSFLIYPATTVYYEENVIAWDTDWTVDTYVPRTQTTEILGSKVNNFGYDAIYADDTNQASGGSDATTKILGAVGTFTFTGTGFDLYANCTEETGWVMVQVKNSAGATVKLYTVNTVVGKGTSGATDMQTDEMYSLPIVSEQDLAHDTYTVTIRKAINSADVNIDGVRIFGTIKDDVIFQADLEDQPEYYQLRDYVLNALNVGDSEQYGTLAEMAAQVYAGIGTDEEKPSAVILADGKYENDVQDLLDNGPKNEVYLHAGETLAFNVTTSRAMQLGLKAPKAATGYSVQVNYTDADGNDQTISKTGDMKTTVDMFYPLGNPIGTEHTYSITITNNGLDILAVTDLKICDDPNAAFVPLTVENIEAVLAEIIGVEDTQVEVEPSVNLTAPEATEVPETTEVVETTQAPEVTETPVATETSEATEVPEVTETPEEPQKTVQVEIPEPVNETATLTVLMVDHTGKRIASVKLTAEGPEGRRAVFTAEEILSAVEANVPKQYALVDAAEVDGAEVACGSKATVTVQVGKVATLRVVYIDLLGRRIGTATITKVQTADGRCKVSAAEKRGLADVSRHAMTVTSTFVDYGSEKAISVPVI